MDNKTKPQFDKETLEYFNSIFFKLASEEMNEMAENLAIAKEEKNYGTKEYYCEKAEENEKKMKHILIIGEEFVKRISE